MSKRIKKVPLIVCLRPGDMPYWAYTAFGGTRAYATEAELEKVLDFIYGVGRWVEIDRRLAGHIDEIPAEVLCQVRGDVPKLFNFVRELAETPWGEWKLRALHAKASRLVTAHTYK